MRNNSFLRKMMRIINLKICACLDSSVSLATKIIVQFSELDFCRSTTQIRIFKPFMIYIFIELNYRQILLKYFQFKKLYHIQKRLFLLNLWFCNEPLNDIFVSKEILKLFLDICTIKIRDRIFRFVWEVAKFLALDK